MKLHDQCPPCLLLMATVQVDWTNCSKKERAALALQTMSDLDLYYGDVEPGPGASFVDLGRADYSNLSPYRLPSVKAR